MKTFITRTMKKLITLIIILIASIIANQIIAQTYTFDLGSSFSPAWTAAATSGTASNGVMVKEMTRQIIAGTNNIDIPSVSALANGIYTITMDDSGNNSPGVVRFIKRRCPILGLN